MGRGIGGVGQFEGEAVAFADEEVGAGEGDVVGGVGAVVVDVVVGWGCEEGLAWGARERVGKWRAGEHGLFEFLAAFLELLHWGLVRK